MPPSTYFISRVTSEFEDLAKILAEKLQLNASDRVIVQNEWTGDNPTLADLDSIVGGKKNRPQYKINVVIHLVGQFAGAVPPPQKSIAFVKQWRGISNVDFSNVIPGYRPSNEKELQSISYTQWEPYMAYANAKGVRTFDLRDFSKERATKSGSSARPSEEDDESQKRHLQRLAGSGVRPAVICPKAVMVGPKTKKDREKWLKAVDEACATEIANIILRSTGSEAVSPIGKHLPSCLEKPPIFVGRKDSLDVLDQAFSSFLEGKECAIQIVAPGGQGKTRLVATWLHEFHEGARRVRHPLLEAFSRGRYFGFSLYAQGANGLPAHSRDNVLPQVGNQKIAVGRALIDQCGRQSPKDPGDEKVYWFDGAPGPEAMTLRALIDNTCTDPERLAEALFLALCEEETILVLDGLEPSLRSTKLVDTSGFKKQDGTGYDPSKESVPENDHVWVTDDPLLRKLIRLILEQREPKCFCIVTSRCDWYALSDGRKGCHPPLYLNHLSLPLSSPGGTAENGDAVDALWRYVCVRQDPASPTFRKEGSTSERPTDPRLELLKEIATRLRGHALSIKLAGILVANGVQTLEQILVSLDLLATASKAIRLNPSKNSPRWTDKETEYTYLRANALLRSYEDWFMGTPAMLAMGCISIFDRGVTLSELQAVSSQLIKTSGVQSGDCLEEGLNFARELQLVTYDQAGSRDQGIWEIDHPIIREHFSSAFKRLNRTAFHEAHCDAAKHLLSGCTIIPPDLMNHLEGDRFEHAADKEFEARRSAWEKCGAGDELEKLARASYHLNCARRHRTAWRLLWNWVLAGDQYAYSRFFGNFLGVIVALSEFYETPWHTLKSTVEGQLTVHERATIHHTAGFHLRARGRISEAHDASHSAFIKFRSLQGDSNEDQVAVVRKMSDILGNIAEYYMVQSRLRQALMHAEYACNLADMTGQPYAKFIHRIELAEILHRINEDSEKCVAEANAIRFEDDVQKKRANLYCLSHYRLGLFKLRKGTIGLDNLNIAADHAIAMASELTKYAGGWGLNVALSKLLEGVAHFYRVNETYLSSLSGDADQAPDAQDWKLAADKLQIAEQELRTWNAYHHIWKARNPLRLCRAYERNASHRWGKEIDEFSEGLVDIDEMMLFRLDAELVLAQMEAEAERVDESREKLAHLRLDRLSVQIQRSNYKSLDFHVKRIRNAYRLRD